MSVKQISEPQLQKLVMLWQRFYPEMSGEQARDFSVRQFRLRELGAQADIGPDLYALEVPPDEEDEGPKYVLCARAHFFDQYSHARGAYVASEEILDGGNVVSVNMYFPRFNEEGQEMSGRWRTTQIRVHEYKRKSRFWDKMPCVMAYKVGRVRLQRAEYPELSEIFLRDEIVTAGDDRNTKARSQVGGLAGAATKQAKGRGILDGVKEAAGVNPEDV